jgi:hypothetical protein
MYRDFGAPELQREDIAVDLLCARIALLRKRLRIAVVVASLAAGGGILFVATMLDTRPVALTGRIVGIAFAATLLGALFGTNEIATRITASLSEGWAKELAAEKRCDLEPLLDAARILSGGHR